MDGLVSRQAMQDIADAIRRKNGSEETYKPSEMASAITNLSSNANLQDKQVTITENGTQTIVADEGFEGLSKVNIFSKGFGHIDILKYGYTKNFQDIINADVKTYAKDGQNFKLEIESISGAYSTKHLNIVFVPSLYNNNITKFTSVFSPSGLGPNAWKSRLQRTDEFHLYNCTDYSDLFWGCQNLVAVGFMDFTNAKILYSTFEGCPVLKGFDWTINLPNATAAHQMFKFCYNLEEVTIITGNKLTNLSNMFDQCNMLFNVYGAIDLSNSPTINSIFNLCYNLRSANLINWKNHTLRISDALNFSIESIRYIIWHALNGENSLGFENEGATSRTLQLHATPYASWEEWKTTKPSVEDCEYLGVDETEITKYGELTWEDIALNVKLITIGA